jgi:N-acetylmuramoyl-L-alanine amidase
MNRDIRSIKWLVLHCSDSNRVVHDNIEAIRRFHLEAGWDDVGYNYFIRNNGTIEVGRPLIQVPAHAVGYNKISVGICLHGTTVFSQEQFKSCARLCLNYLDLLSLPLTAVVPHSYLDRKGKTCPNFDVGVVREIITDIKSLVKD